MTPSRLRRIWKVYKFLRAEGQSFAKAVKELSELFLVADSVIINALLAVEEKEEKPNE